ncbi:MAG: hypothetical protein RL607_1297 [Bacteroidota bacterium]|jgi:hypothetical protein
MKLFDIFIFISGLGQIFTTLVYPYIRHRVFDWYNDVKKLKPLNQEIAKTYGRYIQGLNFGFGLIALTCTEDLQNGSRLAIALTGLMAAYWVGKVATQIAYYPMYDIPKKALFKWGGYGMNLLFVWFALTNTVVFMRNIFNFLL